MPNNDDDAAQAQIVYLAEEAADQVEYHNEAPASASDTAHNLRLLVTTAGELKDKAHRDAALLDALRNCRAELDDAKRENDAAEKRLEEIKNVYNLATRVLSGYTPLDEKLAVHKPKSRRESSDNGSVKRVKHEASVSLNGEVSDMVVEEEPPAEVQLPTNPISMPSPQTITFNMTTELVDEHREAFYQKLLNCSVAELPNYTPSLNSANLKSKVCVPGSLILITLVCNVIYALTMYSSVSPFQGATSRVDLYCSKLEYRCRWIRRRCLSCQVQNLVQSNETRNRKPW
jgi:hypothetical protein